MTRNGDEGAGGRPPVTAVLYLRTAVRGQTADMDSIRRQREVVAAAARRLHAEVVAEYVDHGRSGMRAYRPGLQHLLGDLPRLQPVYVIVADRSRLARSAADQASLLHQIEQSGAALVVGLEDIHPALTGTLTTSGRYRHGSTS